jgi:hypothetical protein
MVLNLGHVRGLQNDPWKNKRVWKYMLGFLILLLLPSSSSLSYLCYISHYLLTYSMEQCPSWEADQSSHLTKKFPAFYGTRRFFTVLTSARHPSLSWANSIQSQRPPPTSWTSILILSSHLRLGLPNGLFPSRFPTYTLCTPLSSTIRATYLVHLILLDLTTRTILGKDYRSFSSSRNCNKSNKF